MLIRYLIVTSLTLSLSYGDSATMGCIDCLMDRALLKDISCDDKISTILSILKPEITDDTDKELINNGTDKERTNSEAKDSKLEAMDKKLNLLVDKLNVLEKRNHDLEEIIQENFSNLKIDIFNKLEEIIGQKFDASEKHFNERMEAQEKILSDKTHNIITANEKLDKLIKVKPEFNESIIHDSKESENKTLEELREDYNQILDTIEKHATNIQEFTTHILTLDAIHKTCTDLKENINRESSDFKKMIPDMAEDINLKLTELNKKIPENLDENINNKLEKMEKNILDSKENDTRHWDLLHNKLAQNIDIKLDEMERKIPKLQSNMNKRLDALEDLEKSVLTKMNATEYWRCKEQVVSGYNYIYHRMDNETLNHVTYKSNLDDLDYYEMHIAVKAVSDGLIQLTSATYPDREDAAFEIAIGSSDNECSAIRHPEKDYDFVNRDTPKILSPTEFISFNIKIDNGKLEIRKGQHLILDLSDDQLKTMKYFGFSSWYDHHATFLYDCPLDHEDEEGHGIH